MKEAIAKKRLRNANAEAMMPFHHPKLVTQHLGKKREPLLRLVLESGLRGLKLKT